MGVIYRSNVDGEDDIKHLLPPEDFKQVLGYSLPNFIERSGIQAAHAIDDVIENASIIIEEFRKNVKVIVHTTAVYVRTITQHDGNVEYDYLRIFDPYKGFQYGKSIFYTGVENCKNQNVQEITFLAYGDKDMSKHPNVNERFNGYFTWIDDQITMRDDSREIYERFLIRLGIPVVPLHELIKLREVVVRSPLGEAIEVLSGFDFWRKYGGSWYAKIDLSTYVCLRPHKTGQLLIKVEAPKANTSK